METIKIVDKNSSRLGWKIINKEDMADSDVLFKEPKKPGRPAKQQQEPEETENLKDKQ